MGHTAEEYCRSCTDTVHLVQGKWKMHILCAIRSRPVRLGQLVRELPKASKKVLSENLRELEEAGLVIRRDLGGSVPHVEYDFRDEMRPALHSMLDHLADFGHSLTLPSAKPARGVPGKTYCAALNDRSRLGKEFAQCDHGLYQALRVEFSKVFV